MWPDHEKWHEEDLEDFCFLSCSLLSNIQAHNKSFFESQFLKGGRIVFMIQPIPYSVQGTHLEKREAELPETTRNSLKQLETSQKAGHSALCWKQTENKSEACGNLFVKQRGEMPLARQSKHRNAGREIRSTIGRGEEADKAAKKAASVRPQNRFQR